APGGGRQGGPGGRPRQGVRRHADQPRPGGRPALRPGRQGSDLPPAAFARGPVMSLTGLDVPPTRTRPWAARLPFYYGWVNVLVASIAMSATLPGRTYGLGLIKEPLRAELGISDFQFNLLNFWAIILGAAVVLPVGRLIDRFGTRTALV